MRRSEIRCYEFVDLLATVGHFAGGRLFVLCAVSAVARMAYTAAVVRGHGQKVTEALEQATLAHSARNTRTACF
jgi:hypothetical protein